MSYAEERTTFRNLPLAARALFSCFLVTIGIGYLFALTYLFLLEVAPHREVGMNLVQATILKYYGNRGGTRLEGALNGSMSAMIGPDDKVRVIGWIRGGATEEGYLDIAPILEQRCAVCHNGTSHLLSLKTYAEVSKVTEMDLGESIRSLARVSHVHLFGISFIFLLTGAIFLFSEINRTWRLIIVTLPFLAIWVDIGSWWFTKYEPPFAYTVIIGGLLMGLSLAAQILIPLWEMWLKKKG